MATGGSRQGTGRARGLSQFTSHVTPSAAIAPEVLGDLRHFLDAAFNGDFSDEDWAHAVGGVHVWLSDAGSIISHGAVVGRTVTCEEHTLRVGYVEAVATGGRHRSRGLGTAVMERIGALIREHYPLGVLSTGSHDFYARLGWERWTGPTFVEAGQGRVRTPDDDDSLMVLRTPHSPHLKLEGAIVCDWRTGDVW